VIVQGRNPDKISSSVSTDVDMHRFYIDQDDISVQKRDFSDSVQELDLVLTSCCREVPRQLRHFFLRIIGNSQIRFLEG